MKPLAGRASRRARHLSVGILIGVMLGGVSAPAYAQGISTGRVEVSGAARVIGGISFDEVSADEIVPGGGTTPLFKTASRLDGSIGPAASLGVRLSHALCVEVAFAYNSTQVTTRVTSDVEGIPDTVVDAPVRQFMIDGGLIAQLQRWRAGSIAPFVTGGAGYVRQLYDGRTLIETGLAYYVGGGLYYERVPARPGLVKSSGLRLDVRALFMRDGVVPDGVDGVAPAVTVGAFARF